MDNQPTGIHHSAFVERGVERRAGLDHHDAIVEHLSLEQVVEKRDDHVEMRQSVAVGYDDGDLEAADTVDWLPVAAGLEAAGVGAVVVMRRLVEQINARGAAAVPQAPEVSLALRAQVVVVDLVHVVEVVVDVGALAHVVRLVVVELHQVGEVERVDERAHVQAALQALRHARTVQTRRSVDAHVRCVYGRLDRVQLNGQLVIAHGR